MSPFSGLGPTTSFGYADFTAAGAQPAADSLYGEGMMGPLSPSELSAVNTQANLDQAANIQAAGAITMVGGAITQMIASYYAAKQAQYEAKSKASSLRFQADMANVSASMALEDAASILEAGQQQKAQLTMRAGMEMAQELTRQGARGVRIGAGSAAETQASLELVKEIDAYNIDTNAMRQSQAKRMQAVNLRAQGLLGRTSAAALEDMARPASVSSTLLGGASRIGSEYMLYRAQQENRNPRYNYFGGGQR